MDDRVFSLIAPLMFCLAFVLPAEAARAASGQGVQAAGRPISAIHIKGLEQVPGQLVRNQIRSKRGRPYDPRTVRGDIVRITHLGRFDQVRAEVTPQLDGSVVLTFVVHEQPLLADVRVVGNTAIGDETLLQKVELRAGDPADPFLIERGRRRIVQAYQDKGYFVADATIDKRLLKQSGILIYKVREGPKVHIEAIKFQGDHAFTDKQLESRIESQTYFPIFSSGVLNREKLELDADRLRKFYRERGYLDAQVGRRIDLSPNQRRAVVTFLIHEGRRYLIGRIRIKGATVFPDKEIRENLAIAPGDAFSKQKIQRSQEAIQNLYGKLGYIETKVRVARLFRENQPRADLVFTIDEGRPSVVGTITVRGNQVTQSKVILREVRGLKPGRRFDRAGLKETRKRLKESPLFSDASVTVLGDPEDKIRDVLIDVKEKNTGSVLFGAGISSDAGVIGAIQLSQRNFDLTDWPESFKELYTGQAFHGAGQYFSVSLQPGTETSRYSIDFREPYAFETDYSADSSLYYFSRRRDKYDERRFGGGVGIGHRFGDIWSAKVRARAYRVGINSVEPGAPRDVFDVKGASVVTALGVEAERNTTDSNIFPTRGNRLTFGIEQVGALDGNYDFTRATAGFQQFWALSEDFFGRKTVLNFHVNAGYIFQQNAAPVFERFYAGGHRTFRGFTYRGVGPRGIRADTGRRGDDPVGGNWQLLTGLEYNFPIYKDVIRGVLFSDMGTVQRDVALDKWRVSIGTGVRIQVPFLGQAPIALDVAVPLAKEKGDQTQLFSFDLAVPFR